MTSRGRSARASIDSDVMSAADNMSLMEDAQSHISELLEKLELGNNGGEAAEATHMINSMESMLGSFSDNIMGMQHEMGDLLESSRRGMLTQERLSDMLSQEQVRTNFVVNILGSLKVQIESLYAALEESESQNEQGLPSRSPRASSRQRTPEQQGLASMMSKKVNLMLRSVDSLSKLVTTPTKKVQKTITTIDSEVVIHASKLAGVQTNDMAFEDFTKQSFSAATSPVHHQMKQKSIPEKSQVEMERELGIPPSNAKIVADSAGSPTAEPAAPPMQAQEENSIASVEHPPHQPQAKSAASAPSPSAAVYKPRVHHKEKPPPSQPLPKIDMKRAATDFADPVNLQQGQKAPNDIMKSLGNSLDSMNRDLDNNSPDNTGEDIQSQVSLDSALLSEAEHDNGHMLSEEASAPGQASTDAKGDKKGGKKAHGGNKKGGKNITPRREKHNTASSSASSATPSQAAENASLPPAGGNKRSSAGNNSGRRPSFDLQKEKARLEKENAAQLGVIAEATAANARRAKELEAKQKDILDREKALKSRMDQAEEEIQRRVTISLQAGQKQIEMKRRELELAVEKAKIAEQAAIVHQKYPGMDQSQAQASKKSSSQKRGTAAENDDDDDGSVGSTGSLGRRRHKRSEKHPSAPSSSKFVPGSKMDARMFDDSVTGPGNSNRGYTDEAGAGGVGAETAATDAYDSNALQLNSTADPAAAATTSLEAAQAEIDDDTAEDVKLIDGMDEVDQAVLMRELSQGLPSEVDTLATAGFDADSLAEKRRKKLALRKAAEEKKAAELAAARAKAEEEARIAQEAAALANEEVASTDVASVISQLPPTTPGGTQIRKMTANDGTRASTGKVDPVEMINAIFSNVKGDADRLEMIRINAPYIGGTAEVGTCTALDGMDNLRPTSGGGGGGNLNDLSREAASSSHVVTGLSGYGNTPAALAPPAGVVGRSLLPGSGKDPDTTVREHVEGQYQVAKEDLRQSYEVAKAIMRRSFDQDTYAFMQQKLQESAVDGVLGPKAADGGLFELPVFFDGRELPPAQRIAVAARPGQQNTDNQIMEEEAATKDDNFQGMLVARTYKPQSVPGSFIDALGQSEFPLYLISEEYAAFLPRAHKLRLQTSAILEDRLKDMLPQSNALRQLIASLLETILRLSTDCDKMLKTLDACEGTISNLIAIVKSNPDSLPMINISVQMSDLYSNFGDVEAGKIGVDLQMFEFRAMFQRINAQGMRELSTLMKESSDFEYCYKYFVACQGKSVEIHQRLDKCRERCLRYKLVMNPDLRRAQGGGGFFSDADEHSSVGMGGTTYASTAQLEQNNGNGINAALQQEVSILQKQVADLQEDVETLQEELEDTEVEMLEVMKEKDKAPDALSFFALMHDPAYVQNLQQLAVQLRAFRSFVDGSAHMDFVTLRKRLQVCVALTPSIEKLNDKYNSMYTKWTKFRLNWFAERKMTGGSADNFSSCPLCFTRLGAPPPNQDNAPGGSPRKSSAPKSKLQMQKEARRKKKQTQNVMSQSHSSGLQRGGASVAFEESAATDQNYVPGSGRRPPIVQKHQINLPSIVS